MMKVILICFALLFIEGNFNLEVEVEGLNGTKGTEKRSFTNLKTEHREGMRLLAIMTKIKMVNSIKTCLGHPLKSMGFQTMPAKYFLHLAFKMQVSC